MTQPDLSKLASDEVWQRLQGTWIYCFQAANSQSVMKLQFTPDRRMVRSSSLSGGVLPLPMTNQTVTPVTSVAANADAIRLTLGPSQFGRAGGVMSVRFVSDNQIAIEDGPTYTREA